MEMGGLRSLRLIGDDGGEILGVAEASNNSNVTGCTVFRSLKRVLGKRLAPRWSTLSRLSWTNNLPTAIAYLANVLLNGMNVFRLPFRRRFDPV